MSYASTTAVPLDTAFTVPYSPSDSLTRVWGGVRNLLKVQVTDSLVSAEGADIPLWVHQAVAELNRLQSLPRNWDSYGGLPLRRRHMVAALNFLAHAMRDGDIELPEFVPLADGGVQLEWRLGEMEIDFIADEELDEPAVFLTRGNETQELVGPLIRECFASELRELLSSP